MVKPYPPITTVGDEDLSNPAMLLFGSRFYTDQTVSELLVELLLVASSPKKIGDLSLQLDQIFPERQILLQWPDKQPLKYAAKARLNLKLFSFLGASKLETRHDTHRQHYRELLSEMEKPHYLQPGSIETDEVLRTLENLFLGFQGVGGDRTWCAQAFIPISKSMLAAETLWNDTEARINNPDSWDQILTKFHTYFSLNRHRFLARGGELLYLQICNALSQDIKVVQDWCSHAGINFNSREFDPEQLREQLQRQLNEVLNSCPTTIDRLAEFIDMGIDSQTAAVTDHGRGGERFTECDWCPAESWPEGLLFAVELVRICSADIDPIKRIELLEIGCAMQVLRSLFAQSARYVPWTQDMEEYAGPFKYLLVLSDPEGRDKTIKQVSRRNVKTLQKLIFDAIRHPDIAAIVARSNRFEALYKEADTRYGHKFFITLAKRLGLIIPKRGAGARFVLNELLLRFLVMALIPPGKRVTYETFKDLIFTHYGMAVDNTRIGNACQWSGTEQISSLPGNTDSWLFKMLDEAGVLVRLSDSHSLVINPFAAGETT
jgi:hypothetical protein